MLTQRRTERHIPRTRRLRTLRHPRRQQTLRRKLRIQQTRQTRPPITQIRRNNRQARIRSSIQTRPRPTRRRLVFGGCISKRNAHRLGI